MKEEKVIIRADRAGVFFGILKAKKGDEVKLSNCRRIWYWSGAASISELALSGDGDGSGDGYGFGDGIKNINGQTVYYIDGIATIIETVHDNRYAKGYILRGDLTLAPTYVARIGNSFAHGKTLKQAVAAATEKWLDDEPLEEKVARFKEEHPDLDTPYGDLFKWHHILTGSCEAGRREWCRSHGYQPTDSITVRTFIEQTRYDYGSDAIRAVAEAYGITLKTERP